ncbi:MAG: hypothetical protein ACM3MI_06235 [Clostridiales bacterium]
MKQYEYRIIKIEFDEHIQDEEKIISTLNQYGKEGWLVCSMNVDPRVSKSEKYIKVLMARERAKKDKKLALEEPAVSDTDFVESVIKTIENGSSQEIP